MDMAKFLAWKLVSEISFIKVPFTEGGGNATKEVR
jgi:hypothetical protein